MKKAWISKSDLCGYQATSFGLTRSSADADKPARRHVIYNRIGRCAAELLRIFDFQNSGRPFWIWYDVIADNPRLVFDGPNILLKLHVHCVNILRDIAIFTRATHSIARSLLRQRVCLSVCPTICLSHPVLCLND